MKWKILFFIFLSVFYSSISAGDIILTDAQSEKLKQNLLEIKKQQTSLQLQLTSSELELKKARSWLKESEQMNLELTNELQKQKKLLDEQRKRAETLSNSLTSALQYSKRQKRQKNKALGLAAILLLITVTK